MDLKIGLFIFLCNVYIVKLENDSPEFVSPVLHTKKNNTNWFSFAGKTYYVDTIFKANFCKALQFCRQQGMHLLSINSVLENERIRKFINNNGLTSNHHWTSASNHVGDNKWFWLSTGQNFKYSNWYPGEPSGKNVQNGTESCMEIRPLEFAWNDIDCLVEMYFICESVEHCDHIREN